MQPIRQRARLSSRSPLVGRAFPRLEQLESRIVPYTVSGNAWPIPQLITLSFVPDGTDLGGAYSNLFATFNAKWPTATWENQIIKAAQVWAQQTNINFTVIADSGAGEGSGNYQQGDPTMGDIRIAGFNFGSSALAQALMPPPVNNYSVAGDLQFNTSQTFTIGSLGYDLFTVAAHEIGHSLGLYHSTVSAAVMYSMYDGLKTGLNSDDIAGIRNIYSNNNPRSYDAFNGTNTSFSTAVNLTSLIDANLTVLETGLDITTTSQKEYFTITVPSGTTGTMTVTVQSSGLSLLAPSLTVYNSAQSQIATKAGSGELGSTISLSISGVSAGQQYYVVVGGANTTAFGTGHYAMTFQFGSTAPQPVPLPNTQVLNGYPIQGGGGLGEQAGDPRGKDTSWDSFGVTEDDGTPAKGPTTGTAAVAAPQTPAAPAAEIFVGLAHPGTTVAPLFAAATWNTATPPAPLTPWAPLLSQYHLGRWDSGAGSAALDAAAEDNQTVPPVPQADELLVPGPANEERIEMTAEQALLSNASWRQAADAYFLAEPGAAASSSTGAERCAASDEPISPIIEAAAAAAVALALEPKPTGWRDNRPLASAPPLRRRLRL